jgi:two-component system CheB/CheR fusion protein
VHRERAVAIVMSGTGSDGAVGLTRIKEQGGVTLAQLPADAEHEGMPRRQSAPASSTSCCRWSTCRRS